jgi:hypothetical protein
MFDIRRIGLMGYSVGCRITFARGRIGSDRPENSGYFVNTHRDTYTTSHRKYDPLDFFRLGNRYSLDLQLANAEEWQDGKNNGALGEVFIR